MRLFGNLGRLLRISTVLARYRLDDILSATHLFGSVRIIRVLAPWGRRKVRHLSDATRLRLALEELGPIFVKLGQVLSTRRDLLNDDYATELSRLRDRVPPFPSDQARAAIIEELKQDPEALFASFEDEPLASASIAQVHAATLHSGEQVVVKIIRPGISEQIRRDMSLIRTIARNAQRYLKDSNNIRPLEIVDEVEKTIYNELDLQREAANASVLRRNFKDAEALYIPKIFWDFTAHKVLVMERVSGIVVDDLPALTEAGVNLQVLAERGIHIFYTQVFRDNFFHADMHPGNIMIDVSDPEKPVYNAVDFGIVGSLPPTHQYFMAENFLAFFKQDYRRVAELHIESGWVPDNVRVDELEAAIRTVSEPQFSKSLAEISFAEVLFQLFAVARQYGLVVQPELILLQKTLLNIEGIGRHVYPDLDIWATSKPILEKILSERGGIDQAVDQIKQRLPGWIARAPQIPTLLVDSMDKLMHGELVIQTRDAEQDDQRLQRKRQSTRQNAAILSAGLLLGTVLLYLFDQQSPQWWQVPASAWGTGSLGLLAAIRALR